MSDVITGQLPEVSGLLDREYLEGALARACLGTAHGSIRTEPLLGGRTNATVQRIHCGQRTFVLKFVHQGSWRISGMGLQEGGEALLWAHGLLRELAGPVECPIVDVGYEPGARRYWVLMADVGGAIRDRGKYTRGDTKQLFSSLATMQAGLDRNLMDSAPLPLVSGPTDLLRRPLLHLSGKAYQEAEWVPAVLEDFKVMAAFLPLFLELLGPSLSDAYLDLAADDQWVRMLDEQPPVLLHGDLRRANMAMRSNSIALFDWEFAARGPAGCDLQWHNLLHYWGYPPDGAAAGDDCDDLAALYIQELSKAQDGPVDRAAFERGWALGWIKVMVQIGYVLVDPLHPDGADAATTERVRQLCHRAVQRALHSREALG